MNQEINVHERLEQLMQRRKVNLTKDVRFQKLRTVKWNDMIAAKKSDAVNSGMINWM